MRKIHIKGSESRNSFGRTEWTFCGIYIERGVPLQSGSNKDTAAVCRKCLRGYAKEKKQPSYVDSEEKR